MDALLHEPPRPVNHLSATFHLHDLLSGWVLVRHTPDICGSLPNPLAAYFDLLLAVDDTVMENAWKLDLVALG